jgi:hypothetical protein
MRTQKNVSSLLMFLLLLHLTKKSNSADPCVYDLNPKGKIDLSTVGHKDGTPLWKSITPEKGDGHGKCGYYLLA